MGDNDARIHISQGDNSGQGVRHRRNYAWDSPGWLICWTWSESPLRNARASEPSARKSMPKSCMVAIRAGSEISEPTGIFAPFAAATTVVSAWVNTDVIEVLGDTQSKRQIQWPDEE
jgi:hypothetical protein